MIGLKLGMLSAARLDNILLNVTATLLIIRGKSKQKFRKTSVYSYMFCLSGYIMMGGWLFCLTLASLPLFEISDYRVFAICLPFDTENAVSLGKFVTHFRLECTLTYDLLLIF